MMRAFTLVELIIVIAIIAVLSTLLVTLIPRLRGGADATVTASRIQDASSALQMTTSDGGRASDILRRALRTRTLTDLGADAGGVRFDDLEFRPLRDVLGRRMAGKTFAQLASNRTGQVPNWAFARSVALSTAATASLVTADWVPFTDAAHPFPNLAAATIYDPVASTLGERLDDTLEVMPESGISPSPAWFRTRWPRVWPTSDWDQAVPGRIPVRWGSPWGARPLQIGQGGTAEGAATVRSLAELSPLDSIPLLQAAGILDEGAAGEAQYRSDRGKGRNWNDRWGNPLVVVSAAFVPNRHEDGARTVTYTYNNSDGGWPARWTVLGYTSPGNGGTRAYVVGQPRDALLQGYRTRGDGTGSVYLAIAAAGPVLREPLPATWTAAEDAATLRQLWRQVRDTCRAGDWAADGFTSPPWSGTRTGKYGEAGSSASALAGEICFLGAPLELR